MTKVKKLFTETEKALAAYKEQVKKLDEQERELNTELATIEAEMTANVFAQENATVSESVYLKIQAKELVNRNDIINVLLEELAEERSELKLKFVPVLREALAKTPYHEYNATEIAERYRYMMLTEIADIGGQMREQFSAIAPDIREVFQDQKVKERYPRLANAYEDDRYSPSFSWMTKSVISKDEVFSACKGWLPQGLKAPKEDGEKK
ncbi:hypothetical protein CEQ83_02170 [Priestia megaterium]|uniref:hypothetical protein n=1 Tax=Priestia megaterium TaxID=1404 RepID=UPI0012A98681|nr:hypothetical protein [Priestia megaterium]QFY71371.1 hypothetical protein CEQ83_02170 [Priestia megaterium]